MKRKVIVDGNEAASYIAYKTNEVCAIYPITPASPMGEHVDAWSAQGRKNIWGQVPNVVELQSEGGAAGAVHGSLQGGALTTTFTASQGLLLMIPNMFKIAGELNPTVFHIAARSVATHALSIFGDHSDVMSTRTTGWAMLFSSSVQESMDMALIAHAATLKSRIPFLHIFDGFRTSHELSKIEVVEDDVIRKLIDDDAVEAHRKRSLNPENPVIRGTAQNPDVFFQAREAANTYYENLPGIVQDVMKEFGELTGRKYELFNYFGHPEAEKVIILMGSGTGAVHEAVDHLVEKGEKIGFLQVRLYRPFDTEEFFKHLPDTVKKIAVLDRTKEPGALGEPLYQDVVNTYMEARMKVQTPYIVGGRYGLSSKEFTPAMVKGIYEELDKDTPKNHFTIGIEDDVTHTNLSYDPEFIIDKDTFNAMFFGLGSDGTVSANKNSIKIIGETSDEKFVQGYFVYDSKKAGALTTSHLRFGNKPIESTYLISKADFVGCHQYNFVEKFDILETAKHGATFLLNSPYGPDEVWDKLPRKIQEEIVEKEIKFYVIDATKVARETQMGTRLNTILQACFFSISGILPHDEAIAHIKEAIVKTYSHKGDKVIQLNFNAVDKAEENLFKVDYPKEVNSTLELTDPIHGDADDFVREVLGKIMAGKGDDLPVSAFPIDGTFPTATTQYEKRDIADTIPVWDESICTQCNKCVLICPHAAIRAKIFEKEALAGAPEGFKHMTPIGKEFDRENEVYSLQVSVEDCTGCDLCVQMCPAVSKEDPEHKAINMELKNPIKEFEVRNWDFFNAQEDIERTRVKAGSVKGSQFLKPLFEFSGACSGCGETPYIKLITQLWGDQMLIANATGCSSIYGGNLPSTPFAVNKEGRGPAWSNSLFEDNAEFGMGMRLAANKKRELAYDLLERLRGDIGDELCDELISNQSKEEPDMQRQMSNIRVLKDVLKTIDNPEARELGYLADNLAIKSVWIVGGDGWAYDIGYGGLDHVLASGEDVNILVLDTEVYSNTGGQTSKATPVGASAKFSVSGKRTPKKDLALQAITYGNVYVAQIAMGAKDAHSVRSIKEANDYPGPSLIIAYSHCGEHGYHLGEGAEHQQLAVDSGYWPLYNYDPRKPAGKRFNLASKSPIIPLEDYVYKEGRYTRVIKQNPEVAKSLLEEAKDQVAAKWLRIDILKQM
jgi:pyruvate-ferredoxin/flavodoxin oxidoreductase